MMLLKNVKHIYFQEVWHQTDGMMTFNQLCNDCGGQTLSKQIPLTPIINYNHYNIVQSNGELCY